MKNQREIYMLKIKSNPLMLSASGSRNHSFFGRRNHSFFGSRFSVNKLLIKVFKYSLYTHLSISIMILIRTIAINDEGLALRLQPLDSVFKVMSDFFMSSYFDLYSLFVSFILYIIIIIRYKITPSITYLIFLEYKNKFVNYYKNLFKYLTTRRLCWFGIFCLCIYILRFLLWHYMLYTLGEVPGVYLKRFIGVVFIRAGFLVYKFYIDIKDNKEINTYGVTDYRVAFYLNFKF